MAIRIEVCSTCGNDNQICNDGGVDVALVSNNALRAANYGIPFYCSECGAIKFPVKPTRDIVYIWPDIPKTKIGSIWIPDNTKKQYKSVLGRVLAVGPGYTKNGRFYPTELQVGDRVIFDRTVPHKINMVGSDGNVYSVPYMGEQDIKCLVDETTEDTCVVCGKPVVGSICPYCWEEHDKEEDLSVISSSEG
jgi:co-chaperonin GroES (HSP10)